MLSTRRPHLAAAILASAVIFVAPLAAQESTDLDIEASTDTSTPPEVTTTPPFTSDPHYVVIPYAKMTVAEFEHHCHENVIKPRYYASNLSIPDEDPDPDSEIVGNHYKSPTGKEVAPNGEVGVIIVGPLSTIGFSDLLLGILIAIGAAVGIGYGISKRMFSELRSQLKRLADRVDDLNPPGSGV